MLLNYLKLITAKRQAMNSEIIHSQQEQDRQNLPEKTGWENMDVSNNNKPAQEQLEEAPEGYENISEIANRLSVSDATIFSKMKELGTEPKKMKKDGHFGTFITPEQAQEIEATLLNLSELEMPGEDFLTLPDFADALGVKRDTIDAKIRQLGLEDDVKYYRHERGAVRFLSPDQQDMIRQALSSRLDTELPSDDYRTIPDFAKEIGIGFKKLYRIIETIGMNLKSYQNEKQGFRSVQYFSPEQQNEIKQYLASDLRLENPKEGYKTIPETARYLNVGKKMINSLVSALFNDEDIEYFKGRNGRTKYLSPEQQEVIKLHIEKQSGIDNLPEGYGTINDISKRTGIPTSSIRAIISDYSIPYEEFRDNRNVSVWFISPENQDLIVEIAESKTPQSSIPENTLAFYFVENGLKIQQNIRPDWLKNPETGHNLEIDIFIEAFNIGIEYDGAFYHQDVEKDKRKDRIAKQKGVSIIHVRENGCPEMPEDSLCIKRKDESEKSLSEVINQLLSFLNLGETMIDVSKDKRRIQNFMRARSEKIILES